MNVAKEYYKDLSAEELSQDEFFIQSATTPDEHTRLFWKEFLAAYPHCAGPVEEATAFVRSLKFRHIAPPPGSKEKVWESIIAGSGRSTQVINMNFRRRWLWPAAAIAAMITVVVLLFWQTESKTSVYAEYGQVRQVTLPDLSVVTLNANSTLEYDKEWKAGQPREVWLKGEGFFEVKHLNKAGKPVEPSDRFIVHAGKADIEVLGTSFNVSDRRQVIKVVLQSGSVRVNFNDKKLETVIMQPGEVVQYDHASKQVIKEKQETEKYVSWKRKEILLDNTSVSELVNIIENTYGYKVIINDDELLNRKISGTTRMSLENEETLFRSLELMLEVEITKTDDLLHIKKR